MGMIAPADQPQVAGHEHLADLAQEPKLVLRLGRGAAQRGDRGAISDPPQPENQDEGIGPLVEPTTDLLGQGRRVAAPGICQDHGSRLLLGHAGEQLAARRPPAARKPDSLLLK